MSVEIADDYRPSDDEEFMNEKQLAYFRRLLENWKADILDGAKQTITNLQDFSSCIFLVPTETSKMEMWKHLGRKHDKYRVRKPCQLL